MEIVYIDTGPVTITLAFDDDGSPYWYRDNYVEDVEGTEDDILAYIAVWFSKYIDILKASFQEDIIERYVTSGG